MNDAQSLFGVPLSDDDKRLLLPDLKAWKDSNEKRDAARLDFQSKMAVLSAGSIAVLASGAVAIANSAALQRKLPAHFAAYVIVSAGCLWGSLVCCTAHNYLEVALLERESRSKLEEAVLAFADFGWKHQGLSKENRQEKKASLPMAKDGKRRAQGSHRIARVQPFLALASVVLFCLGYLAVIAFICMAVSTL